LYKNIIIIRIRTIKLGVEYENKKSRKKMPQYTIRTGYTLLESTPRQGISRKSAFTLTEVLITLGIIGVVAALTLPVLINNINGQKYIQIMQQE